MLRNLFDAHFAALSGRETLWTEGAPERRTTMLFQRVRDVNTSDFLSVLAPMNVRPGESRVVACHNIGE
jgi:hypothetical protein